MAERLRTRNSARLSAQTTTAPATSRPKGRKQRGAAAAPAVPERLEGEAPRTDEGEPFRAQGRRRRDEGSDASAHSATIEVRPAAVPKSPGGYSGTTARTSFTPARAQALNNAELMIDNLGRIDEAATKIVKLLTPVEPSSKALRKVARVFRGSGSAGRALRETREQLHGARRVFGEEPYINVEKTVEAMSALRNDPWPNNDSWRPDDVFYRANLAIAAEQVQLRLADDKILPLEKLDRDFPGNFLRALKAVPVETQPSCGISFLVRESFDVALEIRRQFAIYTLIANLGTSGWNSDTILNAIFNGDSVCRGWDVPGLRGKDLSQSQRATITNALSTIQDQVTGISARQAGGEEVDMQELKRIFPVDQLVQMYLTWIRYRAAEIDKSLAAVGEVDSIQERIEELIGMASQGSVERTRPSKTSMDKFTEITLAKRTAMLKQLSSMSPADRAKAWKTAVTRSSHAVQNPSHLRQSFNVTSRRDGHEQSPGQEVESSNIRTGTHGPPDRRNTLGGKPGLSADLIRNMTTKVRQDLVEGNKENAEPGPSGRREAQRQGRSFVDPQEGATRVEFEDSQTVEESGSLFINPEHEGNSGEPSQDTGFERDTRAGPANNKRAAAVSYDSPRGKRTRAEPEREKRSHATSSNLRVASPSAQNRTLSATADSYTGANHDAKSKTALWAAGKQPQTRVPWSLDETTYLHEAIEFSGISWTLIKSEDIAQRLVRRDQVALKDKARNLLFDYLKAGRPLPPNFHLIPLNSMQKNQLTRMGIPWPGQHL